MKPRLTLVAIAITMILPACDRPGRVAAAAPKRDLGPRLHQTGRPALWQSQSREIPGTLFRYDIGPSFYQDEDNRDPDYYSIQVTRKEDDNIYRVYFYRDFRIDELPAGFLEKSINDVARFDSAASQVIFQVGEKKYEYPIPRP